MLQKIRDRSSGILATIVLGILALSFALWGIGDYITPDVDNSIALVNGEEVDLRQYQFLVSTSNATDRQQRRELLDNMIDLKVNRQSYDASSLMITDAQIFTEISQNPNFQVDGKFSSAAYEVFLSSRRMSADEFQELTRQSLIERLFRSAINNSSIALPNEIASLKRLQDQTRSYRAVILAASEFTDQAVVTEEDIQAYYDANPNEFSDPEKVQLEFIELSVADFYDDVPVDEVVLRSEYEDKKSRFIVQEQRLVSHILVELDQNANADQVKLALDKATDLTEQARAEGADFSALASENSDDTVSARDGGDLGWVADDGQMVKAFTDAVFELEVGAISDPVKTSFGYHVIQLRELQEERGKTYEEVREELEQDYKEQKAEELFLRREEDIADITFNSSDSLEPAATSFDLTIRKTVPVARTGELAITDDLTLDVEVVSDPTVVASAFTDELYLEGLNSSRIPLADGRVVFIRISDKIEAGTRPLVDVSNDIRNRLQASKQESLAEDRMAALLARLEQGETLDALAEELGKELIVVDDSKRFGGTADAALNAEVFKLPKPETGSIGYHQFGFKVDDYALLELSSVRYPDPAEGDEVQNLGQQFQISNSFSMSELSAYFDALRDSAEIVVFEDRIQ